jgi:phytoene dehydrogenase-like protein
MGQYAHFDPTRAPTGRDTAWAFTHVPQDIRGDAAGELRRVCDQAETDRFAERIEDAIEALAPGFRDRIRGRHVLTPNTLQRRNANLVNGALNGGTAQIHQQLIFRPVPGLARPETPVRNVYLASASAHPGGGVHGACGANAARAAISAHRRRRAKAALGAAVVTGAARRAA